MVNNDWQNMIVKARNKSSAAKKLRKFLKEKGEKQNSLLKIIKLGPGSFKIYFKSTKRIRK